MRYTKTSNGSMQRGDPTVMNQFSAGYKISPRFTCKLFLMVLLPVPPALPFLIIAANSL
jgi:hypothetical protein